MEYEDTHIERESIQNGRSEENVISRNKEESTVLRKDEDDGICCRQSSLGDFPVLHVGREQLQLLLGEPVQSS